MIGARTAGDGQLSADIPAAQGNCIVSGEQIESHTTPYASGTEECQRVIPARRRCVGDVAANLRGRGERLRLLRAEDADVAAQAQSGEERQPSGVDAVETD